MWRLLTVVVLSLLLEDTHQAPANVPGNIYNIISCRDSCRPHDCSDVSAQGLTADGVYLIYPGGETSPPVPVYCDMRSAGGPWTVFQKRFDGGVDFYRGWEDYKSGFGRASGEYWLGLQNIFLLTQKKTYRLRIDLEDFENDARHVTYDSFSISPLAINPEEDGYKLHIDGFKEGDPKKPAGDSLLGQNQMNFSTFDHDRDLHVINCPERFHGAFWYNKCHGSNLNGKYQSGVTTEYATGVVWASWRGAYYSFKRSEMKISQTAKAEQ
ncbi:microfibril-associated glycoprotein 4-like [Hyla sarda]|uniref:microfibril-associated glycoprotein 4-like n=1 Tax=Hyla sarda TaxID=327740 RepID=UPI0024C3450F|nr:microfibril-associated glycoprotein 4-like [Hyla sarda]